MNQPACTAYRAAILPTLLHSVQSRYTTYPSTQRTEPLYYLPFYTAYRAAILPTLLHSCPNPKLNPNPNTKPNTYPNRFN